MDERRDDEDDKAHRIPVRSEPEEAAAPPEGEGADEGPAAAPDASASPAGDADAGEQEPIPIRIELEDPAPPPVAERTAGETTERAQILALMRESRRLNEDVKRLQAELYQEKARAQAADERASELKSGVARAQAEFANYRRRIEKEREEAARLVHAELLRDLLPVLDNFERAIAQESPASSAQGHEDFRKGVELIHKQLQDVLARYELRPLSVLGEAFDPNVHEAVLRSARSDVPADQVVRELQRGYTYKDKLLRPALVEVAVGGPVEPRGIAPSAGDGDGGGDGDGEPGGEG